jgi:hypothetical protein
MQGTKWAGAAMRIEIAKENYKQRFEYACVLDAHYVVRAYIRICKYRLS